MAAIAIPLLTLFPGTLSSGAGGLVRCLACNDLSGLDAAHNVLLFLPIGFLAGRRFRRPWLVVAASAVLSATIELGQVSLIPDRDGSALDVLTNTGGAAIGAGLAGLAQAGILRWVVALLLFLGTLTGTVLLLKPASLPPARLYGQWAPHRAGFDEFEGRISRVQFGTVSVPHGLIPDQLGFREAWDRRASARVEVEFERAATSPRRPTIVARIVAVNDELVLLAERPDALIARLRLRATEAGLRPLLLTLPLPAQSSWSSISAAFGRHEIVLEASVPGGGTHGRRVPLEASLGWALLLPFELPLGEWAGYVSAVWLAILSVPLGLAAVAQCRGEFRSLAAVLTIGPLVVGLAVVPWAAAAAPTHWTGWIGGVAGLLLGWGRGLRAARGRAESRSGPAPPSP